MVKGKAKNGKGRSKKVVDQPEDQAEEKIEEELEETEVKQPQRRLRQLKEKDEKVVGAEPAPKAKGLAKGKAKAKAKGKAKVEKPKAKAAEPKKRSKAKRNVEEEEDPATPRYEAVSDHDEDEDVATPRKELFVSEDEGGHDDYYPTSMELDGKPGKAGRVKKALEACMPEAHMTAKRQRTQPALSTETAGSADDKPQVARKRKTKEATVAKVNLSPFAKKEKSRRKKADEKIMKSQATEDLQMQGIMLQHMKNVEGMEDEADVKEYLITKLKDGDSNKSFRLNEYWKRPAIGVKPICLGDGMISKAPEVAYFGKAGTCSGGWNVQCALVYTAASLMVSWHTSWGSIVAIYQSSVVLWIIPIMVRLLVSKSINISDARFHTQEFLHCDMMIKIPS